MGVPKPIFAGIGNLIYLILEATMSDQIIPSPPGPSPDQIRAIQFQVGIFKATPKVFVTPIIIALNLAVFVAMLIKGVSLTDPTTDALIRWGANFGPLVTHGQWWRLFTAMFLHIGIIHILMNMYVLYVSGPFVERLYGNVGYTVMYLLAGLFGSLVSVAWHPFTVSAGASGAIFGVYGGLFAFLLMQRTAIPRPMLASLLRNGAIFLGINLVYGISQAHVDMSAHLGGFVFGFVFGCPLAQPFTASGSAKLARSMMVFVVGLALSAGWAMKLPVTDDVSAALKRMGTLETASLKLYNDSLDQIKVDKITAPQFDQIVNQQLLPPWNNEKATLQKLRVEGPQKTLVDRLVNYMSLRAEGWSLTAKGITQNDSALIQQANQKQVEAQAVVKSLDK
jgi:rhomboid protease GluP